MRELGVRPDEWDYLIVSDGSGTILNKPCGWASVLIKNRVYRRKSFYGGMNIGTNVMAEMFGFIQPLLWLSRQKRRSEFAKVHILTDCQVVKTTADHKNSRKTTESFWHFIDSLKRGGLKLTFHWLDRESTLLNQFADRTAGLTRKQLLEDMKQRGLEELDRANIRSIYDLNPSE